MTTTFAATFENGVLKPAQPVNLPEHETLRVTVESMSASGLTVGELSAFLKALPKLGDDADQFSQDIRAIRGDFPAEAHPWD